MSQETVTMMKPSDVLNFVSQMKFHHNIKNVMDARTVCIDGRDDNDEVGDALPLLAKPGGNAGGLMTAYAACNQLGITTDNERVYMTFLKAIGGVEKFTFHSDEDHIDDKPGMGCGHLKQCSQDPEAYGLENSQIEYLFSQLPQILTMGGEQRIRKGKHAERAILLIESDSWGVRPFMSDGNGGGTQAFIYHQFLDNYRQDNIGAALYAEFSSENTKLSEQDFIQAVKMVATKQLFETAGRIAKGIPLFTVRINDAGDVSVTAL